MQSSIRLIGAAIDACAGTRGSADTPDRLSKGLLKPLGIEFNEIYRYTDGRLDIDKLETFFTKLALSTKLAVNNSQFPIVVGGDHSCAIGTWSGIADALKGKNQTTGMIWMDAHMDAHTPDDTITGNIHGMPLATLMGEGYNELVNILGKYTKIKPENTVLIGIRSYEDTEKERLERLGVKVYYTEEVNQRGFDQVFQEAWSKLAGSVDKIGLSIDLDGFDPVYAPGVGTAEPNGINFPDCIATLSRLDKAKLSGLEITEGNDHFDPSGKTMQCVIDLIREVTKIH